MGILNYKNILLLKTVVLTFLSNSIEISTMFVDDKQVSVEQRPHEGYNNNIFLSNRSSLMSE